MSDGVLDRVAGGFFDLGLELFGQQTLGDLENFVRVLVADHADRPGVETGRHVERHEGDQTETDARLGRDRSGLVEEVVCAGAVADRRRHPREHVVVLLCRAGRGERDGDGRRVQQLRGDAAETVASEDAAAGGADDDQPRIELLAGGDEPFRERLGEAHMTRAGELLRQPDDGILEPLLRLPADVLFVCPLGRNRRVAGALRGKHDHQVQHRTEAAREPCAERCGIRSRIRRRVADDDRAGHPSTSAVSPAARVASTMVDATRCPMRIAPSTCWYPAPAMSLQAKWMGPTAERRSAP